MTTTGALRDGAWRRRRLDDAVLYLCCGADAGRGDLAGFLDVVLGAGVDIVQLRDKTADTERLLAAGAVFRAAAERHGALFVVNDDPDLAVRLDADGVHVGQEDPAPAMARTVVGPERLIGRSTHSVTEIDRALDEDCDYLGVGPVHPTPTKPGRPGIGLEPLRYAAAVVDRPWFVTGGMSPATAPEVLATGARRLVAVRAITEADDPAAVVADLVALLRG